MGRKRPVVTVFNFSRSAICYPSLKGRDRPEAVIGDHNFKTYSDSESKPR